MPPSSSHGEVPKRRSRARPATARPTSGTAICNPKFPTKPRLRQRFDDSEEGDLDISDCPQKNRPIVEDFRIPVNFEKEDSSLRVENH